MVSLSYRNLGPRISFQAYPQRLFEKIEEPVAGVEEHKSDREHNPGILIDHVHILDLWHGRLQHQSTFSDGVEYFRFVDRIT